MRWDVQEDMDKPTSEFPDWPAEYEKYYPKDNEKHDCAVAYAVKH